jgi:uncharacterized membrane protein
MKKSYWITIAILGTALILSLMVGTILFGNWNNVGWGMMAGWPTGPMHGWGFSSIGWIGMLFLLLVPVGIVLLVISGIIWLVRSFSSIGEGSPIINQKEESRSSPGKILQLRYESCEITRDQYLQMAEDID